MALTVGRVGLEVTAEHPATWRVDGDRTTVTGWLEKSTVADRQALRDQLVGHKGDLVAVTWTADSTRDGYYRVRDVDVTSDINHRSLSASGSMPFRLDLEWVGTHATTEFLSSFSGVLIANSHGLILSEVEFVHAPPVSGDDAYSAGGGTSATSRVTEDGSIPVFLDVPITSGIGSARWSCPPSTFYSGAARVDVGGYTRSGRDAPQSPESFVMGNGLIEVRGEVTTGVSNGRIGIRCFNSTWGAWTPFKLLLAGAYPINEWHLLSIVRNSPEVVIVKLVRDADEAPPTDNRHELTLTLRRGAPFVTCHYKYSTAATLTVDRDSTDAGTAITPTGASSAMAVRDAANDGNGNKWVVGGAKVSATDTTNGGIDLTSAAEHSFFLGFEIGGGSEPVNVSVAVSGDDGFGSPGGFSSSSTSTYIGNAGAPGYGGFFRFLGVTIPQGATITAAYLTVVANATNATAGFLSNIHGNAADNAVAPTDVATYLAKVRSTAFTAYDAPPSWNAGTVYQLPDISAVVQEIVDRAGWSSGNALMVLWDDDGSSASVSLDAASEDNATYAAPLLHVEYAYADTNNDADALSRQYLASMAESVGATLR